MSDASFDFDVIVIGAGYGGFDAAKAQNRKYAHATHASPATSHNARARHAKNLGIASRMHPHKFALFANYINAPVAPN